MVAKALYALGALCFLCGLALLGPTATQIVQFGDPLMVLSSPIFMNGVLLCLFGVVIGSTGRVIDLIGHNAKPHRVDAAFDESKAIVNCPACSQQLRVPKGKRGILVCPKCNSKFEAES